MKNNSLWWCGGDINKFIKRNYENDLTREGLNKIILQDVGEAIFFCLDRQSIRFTFDCDEKPEKLDVIYCGDIELLNLDGKDGYILCNKGTNNFLPLEALTYKYKLKK